MTNDERRNGPRGRVASARADADAADRRLEQASRSRLDELMRLSPQARLAHIADVALVATDRATLRRSIQAQLPIRRLRLPWRLPSLSLVSWLGRLDQETFVRGTALSVLVVVVGIAGWWTTATAFILPEAEEITFRMPEGGLLQLKIPAGTRFGLQQRDGLWTQRLWLHGRGYARTQLYARSSSQ